MVLNNIKNLRGFFYKKFVGEKGKEEPLPGFVLETPEKMIVELPDIDDVEKFNVIYPLLEPFSYAQVKWDDEQKVLVYNVIEPALSGEERKVLDKISEALIQLVEVGLVGMKDKSKAIEYLQKQTNKVLKDYGIVLTQNQYIRMLYYIYRNFVGFNEIDGMMLDPNIEDISCDGVNTPLYVLHRKYNSIRTNVSFDGMEKLREFVIKLSERSGRYVSYAEPILDGTLPDGSRVSATIAGDVATRGPTFTIRKFGDKPLSPIEQIQTDTVTSEILAYFWYLTEHGANILFVGPTATGKTTFLNSVCMFIPPEKKIVSIEDTREIRIPHDHWVSGLARTGFGIPTLTGEKYGEVTMFDLLRESFRQNPDYVIVGETRGKEAYVMFQGMASGHSSFSTFHANSVESVIKRLTSPPIELSASLIESLNVITIMSHTEEKSKRKVREVVEIISVDPNTNEVKTNLVFLWNPGTNKFEKVNDSQIVQKLVDARGASMDEAREDLKRREEILDWLVSKNISDYLEVVKYINMFYKEPKKLFELMGKSYDTKGEYQPVAVAVKTMPVQTAVQPDEGKKGRVSILDLLGFRMVREKQ